MHSLNFSTDFLYWVFNYLTHRQHFVKIDSNCSSLLTAKVTCQVSHRTAIATIRRRFNFIPKL